jgi:hypothetical protein
MAARIVHAYSDENKQSKGGQAGDQTGREIFEQDWYDRDGGWDVMLECTDHEMAQAAAATAIEIADDDSIGYDQSQRWTGADAIQAAGEVAGAVDSEFDCSSLVDTAYMLNGLEIERGYTGNMERRYLATGLFVAHRGSEYTKSSDRAPVGSIYLTAGKHTVIVVKSDAEPNDIAPRPEDEADEIEPPYVEVIGSVNVRVKAGKENERLTTAHDGDKLRHIGTDAATGWYEVMTAKGAGFITNKPKYTKLVTE